MAGKKSGFLTEPRREFLKTPRKERLKTYTESQRNQFDTAIREQANQALEDLLLIAQEYDVTGLQTIFSKETMETLVDALMDRMGMEEAEDGEHYYEVFVKTIEHRIKEKYLEWDRYFKLELSDYPILPSKPAYRDVKAYLRK